MKQSAKICILCTGLPIFMAVYASDFSSTLPANIIIRKNQQKKLCEILKQNCCVFMLHAKQGIFENLPSYW